MSKNAQKNCFYFYLFFQNVHLNFVFYFENKRLCARKYTIITKSICFPMGVTMGVTIGVFVYHFYPFVRIGYLPLVRCAHSWQISHPHSWI